MRLPKKTTYLLLLTLILVNILLRFPKTPHAIGVDSFVIKGLADSIAIEGHAAWMLHPLSYLGLYPLSYPSGGMYLIASFEVLTNDIGETSLLVISILLGVLGVLISFMMAKEFRDDDVFALIVAFLFSLSPKFIATTLWESPTRSAFMTFAPLFLWALMRAHKNPNRRNFMLVITILIFIATFHRLVVLMMIVIIAYIVTSIFIVTLRLFKMKFPGLLLRQRPKNHMKKLAIAGFLLLCGVLLVTSGVLDMYSYGKVASGTDPLNETINLGVSLTRSVGLLLPFFLVGIVVIGHRRNKTIAEPLFLFVIVGLVPTLLLRLYTGFYVLPFISIFIGAGLVALLSIPKKRKYLSGIAVSALLVASITFSAMVVEYEISEDDYISNETYSAGTYAREMTLGSIVANDGLTGSRISMLTHRAYLPLGGATTVHFGPEQLSFGFVQPDEVEVVQVALTELTLESDSPFDVRNVADAEKEWAALIMDQSYSEAHHYLVKYDVRTALEVKNLYESYRAYGKIYEETPFLMSIHGLTYKLYEDSTCMMWTVR